VAVENLMFDLSMWRCSGELKKLAQQLAARHVDPLKV
jgi:hypothetical protein